jgi:hypothetical protein
LQDGEGIWDLCSSPDTVYNKPKEAAANARLIAAAPELLEAVQICLKAEYERSKDLLPNAPASRYTEKRISFIESVLAKVNGSQL